MKITLQTYNDYLEDVLSLDIDQDDVADRSLNSSNMFDFFVKEEPLGKDDLRALHKDRKKKDTHNMSKFFNSFLTADEVLIFVDFS